MQATILPSGRGHHLAEVDDAPGVRRWAESFEDLFPFRSDGVGRGT